MSCDHQLMQAAGVLKIVRRPYIRITDMQAVLHRGACTLPVDQNVVNP
jgi:hypothetical protein